MLYYGICEVNKGKYITQTIAKEALFDVSSPDSIYSIWFLQQQSIDYVFASNGYELKHSRKLYIYLNILQNQNQKILIRNLPTNLEKR